MDNNALLAFLITFIILDALIFGFWIYTAYCYHRDCYDRSKIDLSDYHVSTITKATPLVKNTIDKEQLINAPLHVNVNQTLPLPPNYTATEWAILKWGRAHNKIHAWDTIEKKSITINGFTLTMLCTNVRATKKDVDHLVKIGKDIQSGKYNNVYSVPFLIQTDDYRFIVVS